MLPRGRWTGGLTEAMPVGRPHLGTSGNTWQCFARLASTTWFGTMGSVSSLLCGGWLFWVSYAATDPSLAGHGRLVPLHQDMRRLAPRQALLYGRTGGGWFLFDKLCDGGFLIGMLCDGWFLNGKLHGDGLLAVGSVTFGFPLATCFAATPSRRGPGHHGRLCGARFPSCKP